jgi:hypothetical protein
MIKKIFHFIAVASFLFTLKVVVDLLDNSVYTASGLWKDVFWACLTALLIIIGGPIIRKKFEA